MKVRLYSDAHREFGSNWEPIHLSSDPDTVLVLAGDIDSGKRLASFIDSIAPRFLAVVYVAGNHEMYGRNIDKVYAELQASAPNAYLLQNSSVTIRDVEFLGGTLWTDFDNRDPIALFSAPRVMTDYRTIKQTDSYSRLTATRILRENDTTVGFLKSAICPSKKQVVVTHHAPSYAVCTRVDKNNCYYYNSNLDDVIPDAGYWFYGHTHQCIDVDCGGTQVKANCVGYPGEHVPEYKDSEVIFVYE